MMVSRARWLVALVLLLGAAGTLEVWAQAGPGILDRGPARRCDNFDHCLQRCNARGGTGGTDIGCATICNARNCTNAGGTGYAPAADGGPTANGSKAEQETCRSLPAGPAKRECAQRANPQMFAAKQGRCLELAQRQGMASKSPQKKDFMQSCMQGRVTDQ